MTACGRGGGMGMQVARGNAGRGSSGGSSWMVPWGDSPWEYLGESSGGSPQGDSLKGIPWGRVRGEGEGKKDAKGMSVRFL